MEAEREQRLRMLRSDLAYASRKAGKRTAKWLSEALAWYFLASLAGNWLFDLDPLLSFGPMWVRVLDELAMLAGLLCAGAWAILWLIRMIGFLLGRSPLRLLVQRFNSWFDSYYGSAS